MQIVIEIKEEIYKDIMFDKQYVPQQLSAYERKIAEGMPLPDNCVILTEEAYSDLCRRAAGGDKDGACD